ncbi:hypothetical protein ACEWY4_023981 [Coilia grayii]|uniref:TNFR-Cys domain-containing protein n=1 Tax=Coilia grayii TaxID=363190 RepID=A0ABD1IZ34_9TELE
MLHPTTSRESIVDKPAILRLMLMLSLLLIESHHFICMLPLSSYKGYIAHSPMQKAHKISNTMVSKPTSMHDWLFGHWAIWATIWAFAFGVLSSCNLSPSLFCKWFLLMLVASGGPRASGQNITTYQHIDELTGQILTCSRCEPGYHLVEHCTATHPTRCALCEKGLYTECWNYVTECLICDNCYENQDISRQCSPSENTKCVCKKGYFWNRFYCKRHNVCSSGYGVKSKGTPYEDTECELCPTGFYAAGSPATCEKHTDCETQGKITVLKGTTWHNAFCASCECINEESSKILRNMLPDFFVHFNMNKNKLERLVAKMRQTPASRRIRKRKSGRPDINDLLNDITAWVSKASAKELTELPEKLESVQLYHAAEKLERKMAKIEQQVIRCKGAEVIPH